VRTIQILGREDGVYEGQEDFTITHAATSTDSNYDSTSNPTTLFSPSTVVSVRVFEVEAASIFLGAQTIAVAEGGSAKQYSVVLGSIPAADVVVNVSVPIAYQGELTITPSILTFTPATWDTTQYFDIEAVNDNVLDSSTVDFMLTHAATSSDP